MNFFPENVEILYLHDNALNTKNMILYVLPTLKNMISSEYLGIFYVSIFYLQLLT